MSPRKAPFIMAVVNANHLYGMNFAYPHEVVKYENSLEKNPNAMFGKGERMTCEHCNTFKDQKHIQSHVPHPTLEGM